MTQCSPERVTGRPLTSTVCESRYWILGSDDGSELALSQGKPITVELPRTNQVGFRLADEAADRDRVRAAGIVETQWQGDGVSCGFKWPTPTAAASRSTLTPSGTMSRSAASSAHQVRGLDRRGPRHQETRMPKYMFLKHYRGGPEPHRPVPPDGPVGA
jgi:hypothetical protein